MSGVEETGGALIQTSGGGWLTFGRPHEVIVAEHPVQVPAAIDRVEREIATNGWHAVGVIAFEAGSAWGLPAAPPEPGLPLAWFALYPADQVTRSEAPRSTGDHEVRGLHASVDREAFGRAFDQVRRHLADGDTYQVNYTFRMEGGFSGRPGSLFARLVEAQHGRCSAYVNMGRHVVCSASPELFFERANGHITTRPMKGTARRGRTTAEDDRQRALLQASPKQRAENVMIVDMMRNDLGRIADVGSVDVPMLFEVERYPNVWQMTSSITARSQARLADIFGALHPSASVTGAPKISTMKILRELEPHARGIYTGAIGHIGPDGSARFNVAIRTAVVDRALGTVNFGIGSGLVWDSNADDEYAECLLKGSILTRPPQEFELLETIRWTPDEGFWLLDRHIARLSDSSAYFGIPLDLHRVREVLRSSVSGSTSPLRVRLLVGRDGMPHVEHRPLTIGEGPVTLRLARSPIDASSPFLFHKTTARAAYDAARLPGCDDTLLWNEEGLVTEATIANVLIEGEHGIVTPPVDCGLLAGTCRAELLARGDVTERRVTVDDVRRARRLWVTNGVQGRRPAILLPD